MLFSCSCNLTINRLKECSSLKLHLILLLIVVFEKVEFLKHFIVQLDKSLKQKGWKYVNVSNDTSRPLIFNHYTIIAILYLLSSPNVISQYLIFGSLLDFLVRP